MMKIKKKNIVIAFIVAVFLAIVGFFCIGTNKRMTKADEATITSTESFSMVGMGLLVKSNKSASFITVNITEDIYDKINLSEFDGGTWNRDDLYHYRLRLYRHSVGTTYQSGTEYWDFTKDDFAKDKDADGVIDQYKKGVPYMEYQYDEDTGTRQVALRYIPCPADYSVEYNYTVVFYKVHRYMTAFNTICRKIVYDAQSNTDTITRSVSYVAERALNDSNYNWTDDEKHILNVYQGLISEEGVTYPVTLKYKTMTGFGNVSEIEEIYDVDSSIISVGQLVYDEIASRKNNSTHLSYFDCIYEDEASGDSYSYLVAESFDYEFDNTTSTGTLTITYRDFAYQDFALFIQDNDTEDEIGYTYVMRTMNRNFSETEDGVYCLTYEYADMSTVCFRAFGWLVEFSADNFTVQIPDGVDIAYNATETALQIYFDPENESALSQVFVYVNAEIIPDYECDVEIVYKDFTYDGNTITSETVSETFTMWYSEMVALKLKGAFADSDCFVSVEAGMDLGVPVEYAEYNGVSVGSKEEGTERPVFTMTVQYIYNTLYSVKVIDNGVSAEPFLVSPARNSTNTYFDGLCVRGYTSRLANISVDDTTKATVHADYENVANSYIKLSDQAFAGDIITVTVEYTNRFTLQITYMDQYKATPFAIKTTKVIENVNVANYASFPVLTLAQVKTLLDETDMTVAHLVKPDSETTFVRLNNGTYSVELTYGVARYRIGDENGNFYEMNVPLSPYTDFLEAQGRENYSILYLNRKDTKYFYYSNDVDIEKLYGFFSVVVFDQKQSNINTWFSRATSGGAIVQFQYTEVRGSVLYKTFSLANTGIGKYIMGGLNHLGFLLCEFADDDNELVHTYYTYLDGTAGVDDYFLSIGGADDAYDDDNATQNTVQDVKDGVDGFFDGLKDVFSFDFGFGDFDTDKLGFIFGTVGILAVVGILILVFTRNNKPPKRRK